MNTTKVKPTKGFAEPLFGIFTSESDAPLLVVGADSSEVALHRAELVRHLVPEMPRSALLEARYLRRGPVHTHCFRQNFFTWQEELADDAANQETVCPVCGR